MAARLVKLERHGIALPDRYSWRHRDPCTKAVALRISTANKAIRHAKPVTVRIA